MREEPDQTCTEPVSNPSVDTSDDISDSKEALISVIDSNSTQKADNTGNNNNRNFDDSCFKTPELPNR